MNDCVNAEVRDQLPALLHDRLPASARAAVAAHVDGCLDCREELELLREYQGMFVAATPAVSTSSIVAALPLAPLPRGVLPFRQRVSRHAEWSIAAALLLLVGGGGSLMLARHASSATDALGSTAASRAVAVAAGSAVSTAAVGTAPQTTPAPNATSAARPTDAELSMTGRLDDLSSEQLQSLLGEIDNLQATTITEPEATVVPVTLSSDGPAGA